MPGTKDLYTSLWQTKNFSLATELILLNFSLTSNLCSIEIMKLVAECIFHIRRVLPNISNNTRHFCRHRIGGSLPSGIINGTSNKRQRFINPSGRVKNYNLSIYSTSYNFKYPLIIEILISYMLEIII